MNTKMLRMKDIVLDYQVTRTTVYKWISKGLPCYKVEKLLFFNESEVREWITTYSMFKKQTGVKQYEN